MIIKLVRWIGPRVMIWFSTILDILKVLRKLLWKRFPIWFFSLLVIANLKCHILMTCQKLMFCFWQKLTKLFCFWTGPKFSKIPDFNSKLNEKNHIEITEKHVLWHFWLHFLETYTTVWYNRQSYVMLRISDYIWSNWKTDQVPNTF